MSELDEALKNFRAKFALYQQKVERKYRSIGDMDYDMVQAAWNRYLKIRKQQNNNGNNH